ncbi:TMEM175 family protein [Winogradskyella poriferorum]|uniref:TMEM175 family protein n=1 Tax=Winogradskyella poriferorum TaxID=307627 RepID=UPI003D6604E2
MKHSKSRVAALSDGIFAFASTLMVVDIGTTVDIQHIDAQLPLFISFGVAFFVMMMLWKVHYNFFQRTKYVDNWIIAANTLLLFTILFYLFPLKTLINSITQQIGMTVDALSQLFVLYGIGFVLVFASYSFLYWRAFHKDTDNKRSLELKFYHKHFLIFVVIGIVSVILSVFKVGMQFGFPGFVYTLLGPLCYFNGAFFRKKYPGLFS